jgi:Ca-activated chloride channel homolog
LEPDWLVLVSLLVPIILVWHRRQAAVGHSKTSMHSNLRSFSLLSKLPAILFVLAWVTGSIAMARPALVDVSQKQVVQARDIIIAVDISSSMQSSPDGRSRHGPGNEDIPRKIDVARESVKAFIEQREGDRIALLGFSDDTYYCWPLSSDTGVLLRKMHLFDDTTGGTNFDGPSGSDSRIGPIQAAIDHFNDYGQSGTKVFVLVTDGEAGIAPGRFAHLTKELDRMGVRMYVIGVGKEWTEQSPGTEDLRQFVAAMHGVVIEAGSGQDMLAAMAIIDGLERTQVALDTHVDYTEIYFWFLLASIGFWSVFLGLNVVTRRLA